MAPQRRRAPRASIIDLLEEPEALPLLRRRRARQSARPGPQEARAPRPDPRRSEAAAPDVPPGDGAEAPRAWRWGTAGGAALVLAMLAVLGAVLVDRADPEPVLTVAEGSREAAMPEAAPEAASVAPASSMAQADQADGPDALLEEVGRLLRLADRLDRDIDNFVQASRVPDGIEIAATPSPLPRPEQVVATGAFTPFPGNGPDLAAAAHSVVENNAAVLPPPATIALVPSPLVEVPFIPMDMLAGAVPPPDGPNTNPLPASRHGAPVTAADVRASPPKLAAVSEARPSRAIVATPALAARRCQAIILRVQLGEESSHADQRFLRAGCR